jgi:hypothetical protein
MSQPAGGSAGIMAAGGIGPKYGAQFIPDPPKGGKNFRIGSGGLGRVIKSPMMPVDLTGKCRAGGVRIPADRNHRLDVALAKFIEVFRAVSEEIDTNFLHDREGMRMDVSGGSGAGAFDPKNFAGRGAQDSFRHMASTGVSGAKDQNNGFAVVWVGGHGNGLKSNSGYVVSGRTKG